MPIDLTPLLTSAITVLVALCAVFVTVKLVPEVKKLWKPFAEKWPTEAAFLEVQADIAVKGLEQSNKPNGQKLLEALEYVQNQAKRYGYTYDAFAVQMLVEAKVREMKERAEAALAEK